MRLLIGAAALTSLASLTVAVARTDAPRSHAPRPHARRPHVTDQRAPQAVQLASVTLPPPLERVLRDYEQGWRARDAAALAGLFADDGFVLQPGKPPVRGKDAIRTAYTGDGGGALRLRALAYASEGNVGYIIGAYGYGDQPGDVGKFTLTLRRGANDRWLIMSDMDNGNSR